MKKFLSLTMCFVFVVTMFGCGTKETVISEGQNQQVSQTQTIEPAKEEVKQEPAKEEVKQDPVKEEPKQEPAKEEVKQDPVKEEPKQEPAKEEPKPAQPASYAKAYGVSGQAKANPQSINDYSYNLRKAIVEGNFEFNSSSIPETKTWQFREAPMGGRAQLPLNKRIYCETLGFMENLEWDIYLDNGTWYVWTNGQEPIYSSAEVSQQLKDAYNAAVKIYNEVHEDGLTQVELARKYCEYLMNHSGIQIDSTTGQVGKVDNMKYDTAYAALVNKKCRCAGAAAAFNLLMHIEGIKSVGEFANLGAGHIVSHLVLDGNNEYYCDWINRFGVFTFNEAPSKLQLDVNECENTKAYLK